jgi:phosphatidylglycerophosphate synthase
MRLVCQPAGVIGRRSDEHWAGRLYMRGVSIHVTRAAVKLGIGADGVTVLMSLIGLAAAAVVAIGGVWPAVAGVLGIQAYLLLDCVDGEVARWNRTESPRGIYLDRISHYVVESVLLVALGWRAGGGTHSVWLTWGLVAAMAVLLARIETDLVDAARAKSGMAAIGDTAAALRPRPLRAIRRVAAVLPVHRITGAIEASVLILGAAILDWVRADLDATRLLLAAMVVVAVVVAVGHLISVLASDRLS